MAEEVKALGVKAAFAAADVKDAEQVNQAVAQVKEQLGDIDVLINNAGISKFGGFLDLSADEWENIIQVNLMGVYHVTRAVLPEMIERKAGDIINISSTAGQRGAAATSAYSASKFAVLGLTESLMQEVRKHNIRVSALTPSTVASDMSIDLNLTDGNPEKVMQPEDLAEYMVAQLKLDPRIFIKTAGIMVNKSVKMKSLSCDRLFYLNVILTGKTFNAKDKGTRDRFKLFIMSSFFDTS